MELSTYQEAFAIDLATFMQTKSRSKKEMNALTDQIRRSSRSVGANIAEAWSKRRYPVHFTIKLIDADADLQETLHWLMRAKAYGYIDAKSFKELWNAAKQVGRRLSGMLKSGDWF